jgi:hypothetical protein
MSPPHSARTIVKTGDTFYKTAQTIPTGNIPVNYAEKLDMFLEHTPRLPAPVASFIHFERCRNASYSVLHSLFPMIIFSIFRNFFA